MSQTPFKRLNMSSMSLFDCPYRCVSVIPVFDLPLIMLFPFSTRTQRNLQKMKTNLPPRHKQKLLLVRWLYWSQPLPKTKRSLICSKSWFIPVQFLHFYTSERMSSWTLLLWLQIIGEKKAQPCGVLKFYVADLIELFNYLPLILREKRQWPG